MRIAITNPTTWPWVRRGAERFINELAVFLTGRGHEVTIISTKPGQGQIYQDRGYRTICHRRLWHPWMGKVGLLEFHMFFFTTFYSLLKERYDVVFCLTFMDAFAAILTRRITKAPCLFLVNGLPPKVQYFRSLTLKGAVFGFAVRQANAVIAISDYVGQYLMSRWGGESTRIPIPLDITTFRKKKPWNGEPPLIVCAAALDDRRKGGRALFAAFGRVKQRMPDARLLIAYDLPNEIQAELLALVPVEYHSDIEFRAVAEDLPSVLGEATVAVLPSLWEAFGMLVIEALAAGTPVVATRQGALSEHLVRPELGFLFDPGEGAEEQAGVTNLEGLATAIEDCIRLARSPRTSEACQRFAQSFGWPVVGPLYEELILQQVNAERQEYAVRTLR